jgi:hypothetical protein
MIQGAQCMVQGGTAGTDWHAGYWVQVAQWSRVVVAQWYRVVQPVVQVAMLSGTGW